MDKLIIGLAEISVALIVFYTYYLVFLKKHTFFVANRLFLLGSAAISLLLPWLQFHISGANSEQVIFYNVLETVTVSALRYEKGFADMVLSLSVFEWIIIIYFAGVGLRLLLFGIQIFHIVNLKKSIIRVTKSKHKTLIYTSDPIVPFSFLNRIYINPDHYTNEQLDEIIAHESVHVGQRHTFDCLFYEGLIILFWFHPVVYRYRTEAKEVHEFLADQGAIRSGIDHIAYQQLLFAQTMAVNTLRLPNSFNYSLLKRRMIMLTQKSSSKLMKIRFLWFAPVALAIIIVFACNKSDNTNQNAIEKPINDKSFELTGVGNTTPVNDSIYNQVDQMPEFPGGEAELRKFIAQNVKYPEKAKETGTEAKIFVQFIVNQKGKVENVKVIGVREPVYSTDAEGKKVVKEFTEVIKREGKAFDTLEEEAIRVVSSFPDWKPGQDKGQNVNVQFTMPIRFALN